VRVIITSCHPKDAPKLVEQMLEGRWVACGNIMNAVQSIYRWEGKVCREEEAIIMMETSADKEAKAVRFLEDIHPYEIPKIFTIQPNMVHTQYLYWVLQETAQ